MVHTARIIYGILFIFLIKEKNAKVDYINGNGWTILFFIVSNKLWNYFSFLFDLPNCDKCDTPEKIFEELKEKEYEKSFLMESNGDLTYIGQAIKILDNSLQVSKACTTAKGL